MSKEILKTILTPSENLYSLHTFVKTYFDKYFSKITEVLKCKATEVQLVANILQFIWFRLYIWTSFSLQE